MIFRHVAELIWCAGLIGIDAEVARHSGPRQGKSGRYLSGLGKHLNRHVPLLRLTAEARK